MSDEPPHQDTGQATPPARVMPPRLIVALAIAAVFAGLLLAKALPSQRSASSGTVGSLTSVRNDASRDYEAASQSGKPIYVLFHSLT